MDTQIIELEKKYWQGMEDHHYETVKNLTHFPCIVAGKDGVRSVDEATFKKMFESGDGNKIKVVDISNFETQIIGDSAITAYVIELTGMNKESDSPTKCACTSTWIKENNEWLCALHSETELSQQ